MLLGRYSPEYRCWDGNAEPQPTRSVKTFLNASTGIIKPAGGFVPINPRGAVLPIRIQPLRGRAPFGLIMSQKSRNYPLNLKVLKVIFGLPRLNMVLTTTTLHLKHEVDVAVSHL